MRVLNEIHYLMHFKIFGDWMFAKNTIFFLYTAFAVVGVGLDHQQIVVLADPRLLEHFVFKVHFCH